MSDSEALIKFDHVTLGYGAHVIISDLHVRLHKGQIIALIGGSGSGKTTILRATTGQLKPQAGRVELLGHDISKISKKNWILCVSRWVCCFSMVRCLQI